MSAERSPGEYCVSSGVSQLGSFLSRTVLALLSSVSVVMSITVPAWMSLGEYCAGSFNER